MKLKEFIDLKQKEIHKNKPIRVSYDDYIGFVKCFHWFYGNRIIFEIEHEDEKEYQCTLNDLILFIKQHNIPQDTVIVFDMYDGRLINNEPERYKINHFNIKLTCNEEFIDVKI